jgi:hypothetical protein
MMNERELRLLIREMLLEDSAGFVAELLKSAQSWDELDQVFDREGFFKAGGQVGRDLKRAYAAHADHAFLRGLVTIHWAASLDALKQLSGAGRDELSATLHSPGATVKPALAMGLWIRGRITLAAHDEDKIWSGFYREYTGLFDDEGGLSWEEQEARREKRAASRQSSGLRKRPGRAPTAAFLRELEAGTAQQPYILDAETWAAGGGGRRTNEALVGGWHPVGIVLSDKSLLKYDPEGGRWPAGEGPVDWARREMMAVYDPDLRELWSPDLGYLVSVK